MLSSLPDSWDGLVTAVNNSSGNTKLVFEDIVGLILNEEVRKKSSGETSTSALNMEVRGRGLDRSGGRGRSISVMRWEYLADSWLDRKDNIGGPLSGS